MCGAIAEGPLTPREQFEAKFGPIDDEQWQWLKEFVQKYDGQQFDSLHPVIHQKWVESVRVREADGTVRVFPLEAIELVIKQAEVGETQPEQPGWGNGPEHTGAWWNGDWNTLESAIRAVARNEISRSWADSAGYVHPERNEL